MRVGDLRDQRCGEGRECTAEEAADDFVQGVVEQIYISTTCKRENYKILCKNWMNRLVLEDSAEYIFENGLSAASVGTYKQRLFKMYFDSDDLRLVGPHRTILRQCTAANLLVELSLDLEIR